MTKPDCPIFMKIKESEKNISHSALHRRNFKVSPHFDTSSAGRKTIFCLFLDFTSSGLT